MPSDEVDVHYLRTLVVNSKNFTLVEKRKILPELNNLNQKEIKSLLKKVNTKKIEKDKSKSSLLNILYVIKNIYLIFYNNLAQTFFLKYFVIFSIIISTWFIYTSPGWIQVYAFPKDVWKIRQSLNIIKDISPEYYELVVNNTDKIVLTDNRPDGTWWHFSNFFNKRYTYVKYIDKISTIRLSQLLVHEACHGNQDKTNRLLIEPRQKLENECTYLWIHIMEEMEEDLSYTDKQSLLFLHDTASNPAWRWWNKWTLIWEGGNTSQWLIDLLPEEKIERRKLFWENYSYSESENFTEKTENNK